MYFLLAAGIIIISVIFLSSILPSSSYYRHMNRNIGDFSENFRKVLRADESVHLHWIDNFQRYSKIIFIMFSCFARNALYLNKELFESLAWTAHGTKVWEGVGSLSYCMKEGVPVPAMPELETILSEIELSRLVNDLSKIDIYQYESSICVLRDVRRIPLKISTDNELEMKHQMQSFDGLGCFYPYDIYASNIACRGGLLEALKRVQDIDGFGVSDSPRKGKYSILLADVAIYWQLFRILYTFTGLVPIRHDLFLCLGLWHTYQHCHKLLWSEFRSTFLADSFFALFPNESLLFQPKLLQSSTFFLYLRLSYRIWRPKLQSSIAAVKRLMVEEQFQFINHLSERKNNNISFR